MGTHPRKNRARKKKRRRRFLVWRKEQFRRTLTELAQERIQNIIRQCSLHNLNRLTYDEETDSILCHLTRPLNYINVSFTLKPVQIPEVIREDLESVLFD